MQTNQSCDRKMTGLARRLFALALGALETFSSAQATVSPLIKITLSTNKAAAINGREFSGADPRPIGERQCTPHCGD